MLDTSAFQDIDFARGGVAVLGSMNADYTMEVDHLPLPGETVAGGPLRLLPGGKSSNQAVAAARAGSEVTLLGALGSDENAAFLASRLHEAGVSTDSVKRVEGPSGATLITVDRSGENSIAYSPGANAAVDAAYVRSVASEIRAARVLGLCLESPLPAVTEAARIAHEADVAVVLNNSPFQPELPDALLAAVDILIVNEHELAAMLGLPATSLDATRLARAADDLGVPAVIATLGARGSVIVREGVVTSVTPVPVEPVDTTGCGDAFMGTVLAALAAGAPLDAAARAASAAAAYAACGHGAQASFGTRAEVGAFLAAR